MAIGSMLMVVLTHSPGFTGFCLHLPAKLMSKSKLVQERKSSLGSMISRVKGCQSDIPVFLRTTVVEKAWPA